MLSKKNASDCTIEEMVQVLQEGDSYYFEPLFERFTPLVVKFSKMYFLRAMEEEDFRQEARIVLHKSLQTYDQERGMRFAGYFKLMLQHHIYSLIRKDVAYKRTIDKQSLSYDLITEVDSGEKCISGLGTMGSSLSPEDIVQVRESTAGYFDSLSEFEKQVFQHYFDGETFQKIAEALDCECIQVKHAYDRCRQKLKKLLS